MISSYQRRDCSISPSMVVNTTLRPPVAGLLPQEMSRPATHSAAAHRTRGRNVCCQFMAAFYARGAGWEAASRRGLRRKASAGCGRALGGVLAAELVDAAGRIHHLL